MNKSSEINAGGLDMKTVNKFFIAVSGTAALSVLAAAIFRPRHTVKINCNLTPDEYDRICGEFCLKPDNVMMQYVYRRGESRFGVRLAPGKLRAEDIVSMFTIPIMKEKIPDAFRKKVKYPSSDSTVVRACTFTPSAKRGRDYKVHIFKIDGCEYMEIEKPKTDNIGIFLHS
ncbi:MAG: hypothetical protein K2N26_07600 [Oscillospiraceae bacterium]|nr:hypothetical protein [Oscillospiraceae bacterium]